MKQFKVYKDIRKQAVILGLPLSFFALLMTSVILSLLVIIFSFSLMLMLAVILFNTGMYFILIHVSKGRSRLLFRSVFPKIISNKYLNIINYE